MLENIDGILNVAANYSMDAIVGDFVLIRAVERAIQIISEAAKELPREIRALEPAVPWQKIISIGNLLRHEYYRLDLGVLDGILRIELPALRKAVLRLMEQLPT